jgi:hypothetical protein
MAVDTLVATCSGLKASRITGVPTVSYSETD